MLSKEELGRRDEPVMEGQRLAPISIPLKLAETSAEILGNERQMNDQIGAGV